MSDVDTLTTAETVWDMLPVPAGCYRHVFLRSSKGVRSTWVANAKELGLLVLRCSPQWNIYIQLNPTNNKAVIRPNSACVPFIQAILVDIDPVEPDARPGQAVEIALRKVTHWGVHPMQGAIINSGRGYQIWILTHPIKATTEAAGRVRRFVGELSASLGVQYGCRIDTSCTDLPRVARMPGSVNLKTGNKVTIHYPALPYAADWLWADRFTPLSIPEPPEPLTQGKWQDYFIRLTSAAQDFILFGASEGTRHQQAYATARSLRESGAPRGLALELVLKGAGACDLSIDEATRTVMQVYGAKDGPA